MELNDLHFWTGILADHAETILLKNTQHYKSVFDELYKKSSELEMIQNNLGEYGFIALLKTEVISGLRQFIGFCDDLVSLLNHCSVMCTGTFNSKTVNHYIKEHDYVINKITTCIP
ncbi:MAG: DUF2935 domain-containing protein [Oscillospiraceae bacterium]|jgi:hypothetical protein|nr:DUF2935 domain-containing protein [Oscillospiraceae bacterium]